MVAGDIFDHQNPSSTMYKMLYEFFDQLAVRAPYLQSVIIAGNHDSAGRLEAPGPLLKRANVAAIGSLRLVDGLPDLDRHLIEVKRNGVVKGYILAIPYLRPADLPDFAPTREPGAASQLVRGIQQLYQQSIKACRQQIGDLPLVVTGHLHVQGAALSESLSERRIVVGGEHAVPFDIFGQEADYIALGHLHRAQNPGRQTAGKRTSDNKNTAKTAKGVAKGSLRKGLVRYAGSPLPLSVVERPYEHGVSLVTIRKKSLSCKHIKLLRPVEFLRVPAMGRLKIEEVKDALEALALDPELLQECWPFVQIALQIEGPQPDVRARLDEICQEFPLRDVAPDIVWPGQKRQRQSPEPIKKLGELRPVDLFKEAFVEIYGCEPDAEQLACFHQLVEEVGI